MGYPMEIKVNFLCRDSILSPSRSTWLFSVIWHCVQACAASRRGYLSSSVQGPMHDFEHEPVHDLFQQWRMVKETLRNMVGETAPELFGLKTVIR